MLADRPELILVNARVFTMDPARPVASAVAIAGDRIVGIGTPDDFTDRPGSGVSVVNLRGRVVLPGFIDSHCHLAKYGLVQLGLDCKARRISSIGDLQAALAATAERLPPGAWIRARGYDHKRLAERRHPTRWDLDSVVPDHPIHLVRVCGHIAVANSLALDRAGIRAVATG